jgi:uncharacterized protein DUF6788
MSRSLLERRRRILARLPPLEEILRGSVVVRSLRCGKPSCHCAEGEGHRATYLTVTLQGGRTEQISLPEALVPVATRGVAQYHAWWAVIEKLSAINRELIRQQRLQQSAAPRRRSARHPPRPQRP